MSHQIAPGSKQGLSWQYSLFSCFSRCGSCCYGFWCTPCLYGQNVADAEPGASCFLNCLLYYCLAGFGCCCLIHMQSRKRLRAKYGLSPEPCGDCCLTTFCGACGICQEANEIKYRSHQPGAYGGTQVVPPPQQNMGAQYAYPPQQNTGAQYAYPPPSGVPAARY